MVIDNSQGKPPEEWFQIPGPVRIGTIQQNNPGPIPVRITGTFYETALIGSYFRTFEGACGAGNRPFTQPAQGGTEGKLGTDTVRIRFFVTGYQKGIALFYKFP
jgi:hypothetical protein